MRRLPWLSVVALAAACVAAPAEREDATGRASEGPRTLRLHGAVSDGLDLAVHVDVSAHDFDCDLGGPIADVSEPGGWGDALARDLVLRPRRAAGRYQIDVPLRWWVGDCLLTAFDAQLHVVAASPTPIAAAAVAERLPYSTLILTEHMTGAAPLAEVGALSCRADPFRGGEIACRRADGRIEPNGDVRTGLAFFHSVDPGEDDPDVELAVLDKREACQQAACAIACDPSVSSCLPAECDVTRDCDLTPTFVRDPLSIPIDPSALVAVRDLTVPVADAGPAQLVDAVVDVDYLAPERLTIRIEHDGALVGELTPERGSRTARTEIRIPAGDADARDPAGTWTLTVRQTEPFFRGAVVSWGLDLYR